MPITADRRARYPKEWPLISLWVRLCAGWRCERCGAAQGEPNPDTGSKVALTVAHVLNDDPADVRPCNLKALCQRCHLTLDAKMHARNAAVTRRRQMRTAELVLADTAPTREFPDA